MPNRLERFRRALKDWQDAKRVSALKLDRAGAELMGPGVKIQFFVRPMREPAFASVLSVFEERIKVYNLETGRERWIDIRDIVHVKDS